jgi:hypothetical protein
MKRIHSLITLMGVAGLAQASLIYEITPAVYSTVPGGTIQTFATVTNTGPEVLYYAYSFVDPGTVPVSGVTGQLPPLILQPGDRVEFAGAGITTSAGGAAGAYVFVEGVAYHPGPGATDVIEASDSGTLLVVPEPGSLLLCCLAFLVSTAVRGHLTRGGQAGG